MLQRTEYIDQLKSFRDKELVKVVTGIRRCGKSTLFELYREYLMSDGVSAEQITAINFEDIDYEHLADYRGLYEYIKPRLIGGKMNYIFLDEIQHVADWQKCVDSLYIKKNCDVYITGSNAKLLSGELATLLSGRYVEIKMFPLSFAEYASAYAEGAPLDLIYSEYLTRSSFPYALSLGSAAEVRTYLDGIYNSILLKDVVARKNIADVAMLESVVKFAFDNIGNLCSTKSIADTLTSAGRKISVHTVESYMSALCDSFILYKANRFDIKGKQLLKTGEKYYAADIGLRYYLLGSKNADMGRILENVIYLELCRRSYDVKIGKMDNSEVDFIATNNSGTSYYQIALTTREQSTLTRELSSLNKISDHNPKYLLTLDPDPPSDHNGIKKQNALKWLRGRE